MQKTTGATALFFSIGLAFAGGMVLAQTQSRVEFEAGNDNAAINGAIIGGEYIDYLLGAKAGQTMGVSMVVGESNGNGTVYFNVMPPGSTGEAIYNGSMDGTDAASVTLPADGDYTIRVYQMGDDADTGKTTAYTISVSIM